MSDNKNINDEYQYVEESEPSIDKPEFEETSEAFEVNENKSLGSQFQTLLTEPSKLRNMLIIIIATLIVIFIAKCSSDAEDGHVKSKAVAPLVQSVEPKPNSPEVVSNQDIQQLSLGQKSIQENLASLTQQLNQLSSQINSINSSMQSFSQEISGIQTKLITLEQMVQNLKTVVPSPKSPSVVTKLKTRKHDLPRYVSEGTTYYIQAIIPGRAWLINSSGATMTVTVGSRVPGYGVVEKIDAITGVVEVSSHRVLRFNQRL